MAYICTNCESKSLRWEGRCSNCGEWGSLAEDSSSESIKKSGGKAKKAPSYTGKEILSVKDKKLDRFTTSFEELDRVFGGGVVPGSVTLLSGEPGIGKSTLLLQVADRVSKVSKVLYVSGEESSSQLGSRLKRVSNGEELGNLHITDSNHVESIIALAKDLSPRLMVVDSIQSVMTENSKSIAGSMAQVRHSAAALTRLAKENGIALIMVGQINKEGSIAGPKILEHLVDVVLYFDGDEYSQYRMIRGVKNRFGSTHEIGVFEMDSEGLKEVANPSQVFLQDGGDASGVAIGAVLQGSRVVFVEVQALVVERGAESGPLRRVANGIKKPRLDMLCAVMAKRGKVYLGDKDVFVNIAGGLKIDDPSIDLAVCAAIKSAVGDKILPGDSVYVGEVGLTGRVRKSIGGKIVIKECRRLGYKKVFAARGISKSSVVKSVDSVTSL